MASTITITLDDQGNATIGDLPSGVFYSRFATPPDAQIRDVISINTADTYDLVISGSALSAPSAEAPVVLSNNSTPTQATFTLDASQLPASQGFGMALCQTGDVSYSLGVIVNPATVSLPMGLNASGFQVDQDDVPIGVHCDPSAQPQKIAVWAGGGYSFSFTLSPESGLQIDSVDFTPENPALTYSITNDQQTATVFNNNLATSPGFQVSVLFSTSQSSSTDPSGPNVFIIDPTIINNPINQGGGDGNMWQPEPRYELAAVPA